MAIARKHIYNGSYGDEHLDRIAFPLGGIGAGMMCLEGTGALSHVSLRHRPDVYNEPTQFAALCVRGARSNVARVLEGPTPMWKAFGPPSSANGGKAGPWGLPHFRSATFLARFPFATVTLQDPRIGLETELTAWSPFIPGDADNSSLPVCALEYRFRNGGRKRVEAVFSYHAANLMSTGKDSGARVAPTERGFLFCQPPADDKPWQAGQFAAVVDDPQTQVDCAWFRGAWFDPMTMVWKHVAAGETPAQPPHAEGAPGSGASLYVPFVLRPGEEKTVRLLLAWYVPVSDIRTGPDLEGEGKEGMPRPTYRAWYAGRFASIAELVSYWRTQVDALRAESAAFRDCFFDTTLPPEAVEAAAANLSILKSPTVLRQADGRFWAYEGCCDGSGCCHGSCTHVWNYAQAVAHLFPALERSLRETEFLVSQDERGHQNFRASLPLRPSDHVFHAAADGQLGGIMKMHREWRISGDTEWLRGLWPKVRQSLDYCIATWDPDRRGVLSEPHHNTYDIEFWGPDAMCTTFYLGALKAAAAMGKALGEEVSTYEALLREGTRRLQTDLWNGEYFYQKIQWRDLRARSPVEVPSYQKNYSAEALALLEAEGPKYQYGTGCLADGVLGLWMAEVCGVGRVADPKKAAKHLASVFKHNFRRDLTEHANTQRPAFAWGKDGGLLLCTWPRGGAVSLPFPYSNEVWTGIEYQVASHLMLCGRVKDGLAIVRAARDRYDGRVRNPFNEYECGHWYARALSSYGLLQGLSGARYDAVDKALHLKPAVRGNFRAFFCAAGGYGTVGVKNGKPFLEVRKGTIDVRRIAYTKP